MAYKNVAPTEYTETQFFLFGSSRVVGQAQKKLRGAKKIPAADEGAPLGSPPLSSVVLLSFSHFLSGFGFLVFLKEKRKEKKIFYGL